MRTKKKKGTLGLQNRVLYMVKCEINKTGIFAGC